jgi:hypothetical protein
MIDEQTRQTYRRVFNTPDGVAVLTDMLNDLDFFNAVAQTPEEVERQNVARKILFKLGAWRDSNIFLITRSLLELPWEDQDKEES